MRAACAAAAAVVAMAILAGCALLEAPPAQSPSAAAPGVAPDHPAAARINDVRLPALARDGIARRVSGMTLRVRNLSCEGVGTGSGFAIDPQTLVTNRHVVAGADRLEVNSADGRTFSVSAAEVGTLGDIAFVTVDGALPVVADLAGRPPQGEEVSAVGYPRGGPLTITEGVVVDHVDGGPFGVPGVILRTTADVAPGNSGGPLLDRRGRVVGVVYAIEFATDLGLAMPLDTVDRLLEEAGTMAVPPCGAW